MEFVHWLGYTASAMSGAIVALGGSWFWVRRAQLRLRSEEAEQKAKEDSSATKAWRDLMEYKSDDFRKKNQEQDARVATMVTKMDAMHAAHLKCEREAVEREMQFKREAADREIKLLQHEAKIGELTQQVSQLRTDMEAFRAAQKVLDTAEVVAAKLAST